MGNFHKKLSLGVLLVGALALGISSVAKAFDLKVQWLSAHKKQDCPTTCGQNRVTKYAMPIGYDNNLRKATFFICITQKESKAWHPGFNVWGQNTCTAAFGDEVYHGEQYYCLCTNNTHPNIFR